MRPLTARIAAAFGLTLGAAAPARAEWALNMPVGVTPLSEDIHGLHMLAFWICAIIGIAVFGAILVSIIRFRKSKGAVASQWHEHLGTEVAWTAIPFLILVGLAIPSAQVLIDMEPNGDPALTVLVTGYQWKWHYDYVGEDLSFYSTLDTPRQAVWGEAPKTEQYLLSVDNPLVLPVGKRIRFQHTSGDVIHSWWVPALAVKKDSIPGYINTNWALIEEPGIYRGQCAELCGRGHGFMPIVVKAVPPAEFEQWLDQQRQQQTAAGEGDATLAATR